MTFKLLVLTIAATSILYGCSAGPQEVATADIQKATDSAKNTRALFDSVEGDFDKLSAADKKKLAETYKSEEAAKKIFETMKHPPIGGGASGAPAGK